MLTNELIQKHVTDWCRAEGVPAITASFADGTVLLSGVVPTLRHAHLLTRDLLQQSEVTVAVSAALTVEPRREDPEVLRDAQAVLAGCACPRVRLDVFEGVLALTGDESNSDSLQLLEDQLSGLAGVIDIRSTVTVDPPDVDRPV